MRSPNGLLLVSTAALLVSTAADLCPHTVDRSDGISWWTSSSAGIEVAVNKKRPDCFILTLEPSPAITAAGRVAGEAITLVSAGVALRVAGANMSSVDGTLVAKGTRESSGSDAVGAYTSLAVDWTTASTSSSKPSSHAHAHAEGAVIWTTVYKSYTNVAGVVFQQIFPRELSSCPAASGGDADACVWAFPAAQFPTFDGQAGSAATLGVSSFHNQGDPQTSATGFAGLLTDEMGFPGGMPLIMLSPSDQRTLVLSPITSFLSTTYTVNKVNRKGRGGDGDGDGGGDLLCGVQGAVATIPANHTAETIAFFGGYSRGVTETVMAWGDVLLGSYGKQRTAHDVNDQVSKLGYSTVGHYFYGLVQGMNAEQTLRAVKDDADKEKLPFGWYLIDSWWYGEGATPLPTTYGSNSHVAVDGYGGTWRWDDAIAKSRAGGFPSGLKNLTTYLGAKIVQHMGLWVGSNTTTAGPPPYATNPDYPGQSSWVVEEAGSLPLGKDGGAAFWDFLFEQAADWGMLAVKLDHAQTQVPNMHASQSDITAVDTWLTTMDAAAAKHGVWKQYGGCVASMVLHSVTVSNAVTARVGNDYIPSMKRSPTACEDGLDDDAPSADPPKWQGGSSATIGRNTLVWWALGIRPYKDATFSGKQDWSKTTCLQRINPDKNVQAYVLPEWWGLQDTSPSLGLLVSAMAAGPIASCDGVGDFNRDMLMRVSRSDGITLKPSRPAVALDAVWIGDIFGSTARTSRRGIITPEKGGEVTFTYTDLAVDGSGSGGAAARWYFVLGWGGVKTLRAEGAELDADGANLTFADLASSASASLHGSNGDYVAWPEIQPSSPPAAAGAPKAATLIPFGPKHPSSTLAIPDMEASPGNYVLWRVAPVLTACGGLVVLGETSKFISASITRITGISCRGGAGDAKVALVGGPGESVTIEFTTAVGSAGADADGHYAVQSATCAISNEGTATLSLPSGKCA